LFEQLQAMVPAGTVERRIAEGTVRRMLAVYESGASLYAFSDVQRLLELEARELGGGFPQDQARRWSIILFNTVNNPLYRQQALRWVVDAARDMGLTLALYGQGWEDHPDFASHARGPVQYGPELEHLTRRAKINLQIIPYSCFHQRLIDGIAAGGFYLIRHNIFDTMLNDARHFLEQRLEDRDQDLAALRQRLDGPGRAQLADIQNRWEQMMQLPGDTMLEAYRSRRDHGFLETLGGFPHAEEVSFRSPEQLRSLLERFAFDADARKEHWGRQYRYVQQRLTYLAMFKSVRRWMSDRLGEEVAT
jgi:hypothetical protein